MAGYAKHGFVGRHEDLLARLRLLRMATGKGTE